MIAIHNSESSDFEVWEDDKQIALLRYQWSYDKKQVQIEGLFVVPPFRREGIATFLIEQFVEEFKAYPVSLYAGEYAYQKGMDQAGIVRLYRKYGWQVCGYVDSFYKMIRPPEK